MKEILLYHKLKEEGRREGRLEGQLEEQAQGHIATYWKQT